MTYKQILAGGAAALLMTASGWAHHSNSAYQVDEIITLTGTVTDWEWVNPHTWLHMDVTDADGTVTEWVVEGRAPGILGRAGWDRNILAAGEQVTVHASPAKDGTPVGIIARVTKADGSILGNRPEFNVDAAAVTARLGVAADAAERPDFSGVYYPYNAAAAAPPPPRPADAAAPPPPTRSSPTSDGSLGRRPNDPKLTPDYLAQWNRIAESRIGGSYEFDNAANCIPPGVPSMMSAAYGMEIMQNGEKITVFTEHMDAMRRIWLDGRQPPARVFDDPTYAGYSTGRWEGDTLVVDTVALSTKSYIDGSSPHSDQMRVEERIRFIEPGILEDRITVTDPLALEEPWESVRRYQRAEYPNDELREFACAEGLRDAPH